jgi:uncharacterized protein (DUF427 family)
MAVAAAQPKKSPGFARNPGKLLEVEPSPRRVRVKLGGETIADSTRVLLMREGGHLPAYYFPMADVRMDLMTPTDNHTNCPYKGDASYWTVRVGDKVAENAAWAYRAPYEEMLSIADHVAFYWNRVDSWWEEDEEIFVHPRDPKKRVDAMLSHRPVEVVLGGETVAKTENARFLFETGLPTRYYIPREDVRMDLLTPSSKVTRCPYKGIASYFSAKVGGTTFDDIAWCYEEPLPECYKIRGLIAFFDEHVDEVRVDGRPNPRPTTNWSKK